MSKQIKIHLDTYKKFQAALTLTGEDEETALNRLLEEYAHSVFERAMDREPTEPDRTDTPAQITEADQKRLFSNWFRSLTRNGRPYNPVTISGYTGRLENACGDPAFASVPVRNLFAVTDLAEFISIRDQLMACPGYAEFDAKSHNGFTAALKKYEEFLRFQAGGSSAPAFSAATLPHPRPSATHRWTMEEDSICCKRFLETYVIQQSVPDTVQFLQTLSKEVPDVSEGSLRMKLQNIKYLAMQAGLHNTCPLKWLSQYSQQCETAFQQALRELKLR